MKLKIISKRGIYSQVLYFFIVSNILLIAPFCKSYGQEYELPETALKSFIQGRGKLNKSIDVFVSVNGGSKIKLENKKWCPKHEYYIEWKYLQLRYWFIVQNPESRNKYFNELEEMISDSVFNQFRQSGYINIADFKFTDNSRCVTEAELMSSKLLQIKVENDTKAINIFRNNLQTAFSGWSAKPEVGEAYSPNDETNDFELSIQDIGKFQKEMQGRLQGREFAKKINELRNKYYGDAGINIANGNKVDGEQPTVPGNENFNVNASDVLKQNGISPPNTSNGKDNSDGKGKISWLPIKVSFSQWFGHLLEIVTIYLGIDNITKQILSVAYFIAPELFDEVGSFFAKIQQTITPKSLDDFLNKVSDLVEHLDKFYKSAMAIKNMLADPKFQDLFKGDALKSLKNLKVDDIIKGIEKGSSFVNRAGILSNKNFEAIQSVIGYKKLLLQGNMKQNIEAIKKNIGNFAYKQAKKALLNTSIGKDIYKRFPFSEIESCYKTKSREECMKILTDGAVMNLPDRFRKYGNAIDNLVINGDYKGAAKEVALQEINRIPEEYRGEVLDIINGTRKFSTADFLRISENIMKSTDNKELKELATLIKAGRGINYVSNNAKNIKKEVAKVLSNMNLSEEAIANFLNSNTPELLRTMAKGFGFTNLDAQNLFIAGDINAAIQKQVEKGVPVRNWAYYQNFGQEIRNKTLSRIGIYQLMLEAMRQGYIPYNFTRLIQNRE